MRWFEVLCVGKEKCVGLVRENKSALSLSCIQERKSVLAECVEGKRRCVVF